MLFTFQYRFQIMKIITKYLQYHKFKEVHVQISYNSDLSLRRCQGNIKKKLEKKKILKICKKFISKFFKIKSNNVVCLAWHLGYFIWHRKEEKVSVLANSIKEKALRFFSDLKILFSVYFFNEIIGWKE